MISSGSQSGPVSVPGPPQGPLLAIESSCDETAAAVIHRGRILSSHVASQIQMHAEYGGVVPELATREHLANLRTIVRMTLGDAGISSCDLSGIVVTRGPGLPSALLMGMRFAQGLAASLNLPCWGVHHHEGHLYSPWMQTEPAGVDWEAFQPNVSLIVSGGHTLLVHVPGPGHHIVLGGTVDDAAGECFDKVAKMLELPYPGGPVLDSLATEGTPLDHRFPRPMLHDPHFDFSFSGLKTAARYYLKDHPGVREDRKRLAAFCASIQEAIVEVLVRKALKAAQACRVRTLTASGGVSCNSGLRRGLLEACQRKGLQLRLAPPAWCTDNAAMIAVVAECRLQAGQPIDASWSDPSPGWALEETSHV